MRGWLFTALLPPPVAGTSRRAGRSPRPCGVRGHLVEGGETMGLTNNAPKHTFQE